ncbi:MAG: SAM-dependent methyltransferase [Bacteroidales bacterium]|jgi:16S rRNA (cytidine1402-2'-O)-methyltransferase|nr:SAM-dependent methyltransferase [Bacteroidales bacterium]
MENGKVYMVPMSLGSENFKYYLPEDVLEKIRSIRFFIAENAKTARHYFILLGMRAFLPQITVYEMDKHNKDFDYSVYFDVLKNSQDLGVISEAGCPGVADPGASVALSAHRAGFQVVPLVGPSSILLSVMASGLNGQSFAFNGYLPVKNPERQKAIKKLEDRSKELNQTQVFIETPYRNNTFLETLCNVLNPNTLLTVACDITMPEEFIKTQSVANWKKQKINIDKRPAIFLILKK